MTKLIATLIAGLLLLASCATPSATTNAVIDDSITAEFPTAFPTAFHTEGNRIVDSEGNTVVLRGVSAVDPLAQTTFGEPALGTWGRDYYAAMADWGVQLVRIPIHPALWRDDPEQSLKTLDRTVEWIGDLGMYAIIDYHSIGMSTTGVFEEPIYETTPDQLKDFWLTISAHFSGNDVVAFYELFNEPVNLSRVASDGRDNADDWHEWKTLAEEVVDVIRSEDPDAVAIVGGMYWASDLSYVNDDPVARDNIVYAAHPYPGSIDNRPWLEAFGETAERYPVLATEIGFTDEATRSNVLVEFPDLAPADDPDAYNEIYLESTYSEGLYRDDIMSFLSDRGIGWTAWSFSAVWGPVLLANLDYEPSVAGQFFKDQLSQS